MDRETEPQSRKSPQFKEYLGDGVYAAIENGVVRLTAENGFSASDTIYLEAEVLRALNIYVERINQRHKETCQAQTK